MTSSEPKLCNAEYTATQLRIPDGPREIWIVAKGKHPTAGYEVYFQQTPLDIFPPEFELWHIEPDASADVITPFSRFVTFTARDTQAEVFVHDSNGRHRVSVEQLGDLKKGEFLVSVLGMLKDGPFPKAAKGRP